MRAHVPTFDTFTGVLGDTVLIDVLIDTFMRLLKYWRAVLLLKVQSYQTLLSVKDNPIIEPDYIEPVYMALSFTSNNF